ncbi:hypothetical protein OH77DRAFT_731659 [Trametes cingulata]|nr:hypothetical protein OH77DRAFT_731659 [Trametes cingulata]
MSRRGAVLRYGLGQKRIILFSSSVAGCLQTCALCNAWHGGFERAFVVLRSVLGISMRTRVAASQPANSPCIPEPSACIHIDNVWRHTWEEAGEPMPSRSLRSCLIAVPKLYGTSRALDIRACRHSTMAPAANNQNAVPSCHRDPRDYRIFIGRWTYSPCIRLLSSVSCGSGQLSDGGGSRSRSRSPRTRARAAIHEHELSLASPAQPPYVPL